MEDGNASGPAVSHLLTVFFLFPRCLGIMKGVPFVYHSCTIRVHEHR